MKLSLALSLLLLVFFLPACEDKLDLKPGKDYMIISYSHPSFANAQFTSYLLNSDGAYSSPDYDRTKKLSGFTTKLSAEKEEALKKLAAQLPEKLLNSTKKLETFGCPGCVDQGGYSIEIVRDNVSKQFYLDTQTESLPAELKDFAVEVGKTLQFLR